ncbi:MAG: rRNA maturation RNase YbeY [Pseudomonadota bacterium]
MTNPSFEACTETEIADPRWAQDVSGPAAVVERSTRAALGAAGLPWDACVVSIRLGDDASMATLNAAFRGVGSATNVLAWPSTTLSKPLTDLREMTSAAVAPLTSAGGNVFLGDVAVARETVAREADEAGKTLEAHLSHLIVHGVLHLVGYDHGTEEEAEAMMARERAALATIGIADPYEIG